MMVMHQSSLFCCFVEISSTSQQAKKDLSDLVSLFFGGGGGGGGEILIVKVKN